MKKYVNKSLAFSKKLIIGEDFSKYLKLENTYKRIFENYIIYKIKIDEYDKKIDSSNLGIVKYKYPVELELDNYLKSKYFYTLNNFFIEKLSEEQLEILTKFANKEDVDRSVLLDFIEQTYKDVIKNNYHKNEYVDNIYNICYGEPVPSNFGKNNALVLRLYYSNGSNINEKDEFIENMNKQNEFIKNISLELKNEIKEKLDLDCDILVQKR